MTDFDYTDDEMSRFLQRLADKLRVSHSAYGCIGCSACTTVAMLEIVSARLGNDDD